jgi:hypothetical protein
MTSKKCPFCAEVILDEAIKCKHCGEHFDAVARQGAAPTTIEQTGKRWKLLEAGGAFLTLIAFAHLLSSDVEKALLFGVPGLGLFFSARVGAWWYHG